jgi:SPX domain protein involved in polyphosphate accumulation
LGQQQGPSDALTEEETEFVQALSDTLNQLNDIYIEKEETSVIRVERLESELSTATTAEQLNELHKQFVDFHGEVLLLVHWSILAYTATVKILKKHHKRTGLLVKAPQLGNLLSQPFCSTEVSVSAITIHHPPLYNQMLQHGLCAKKAYHLDARSAAVSRLQVSEAAKLTKLTSQSFNTTLP